MDDLDGYAEAVRQALPAFYRPLEVLASVPSTMGRGAELAAAGAPEGATVVADQQTEGRGRLGRAWLAPPGSSLLVTVLLRPAITREEAWLVVAAAGVALAEAVDLLAPSPLDAGLKWPNDLELRGRKAAGLLAEAHLNGANPDWVLLGMGVNVTQGAADLPPELADRATSVTLAAGAPIDRATLLGAWGERFLAGYRRLAGGQPGPLLAAYRQRLLTIGRRVRAERIGAEPVVGTAVDLTDAGALVVQTDGGARVPVLAADVQHLLPLEPPGPA
jgi:BirA family transcriptional regulator, biotin operon repressor / biotin---[acetyl-CoA-carboxylase] ligase